ncbi:MAG: FmdB family zinc ribbon protein [Phycisphaerae bacterium]
MPTYEYECTKCDRVFDVFQPITAKVKRWIETDCKQCKNRAPVRRRIGTGAGLIFKGSGFYQTDYRSESYKAGQKAEQEAKKDKSDKSGNGDKGDKKKTDGKSSGRDKPSGRDKTTGGDKTTGQSTPGPASKSDKAAS